jgi:hypothetical protein
MSERQQVKTVSTSLESIMRTPAFVRGVADKRAGHPPCYDAYMFCQDDIYAVTRDAINGHWNYERGRQWAALAPMSMPLMVDGRLSLKAVALYRAAEKRGYLS